MTPAPMQRSIRLLQVATGNVGSEMVRRITQRRDLELVGLHCYSPDKIGRDAGEIVGMAPVGVIATGAVDDIIAAHPDVVTFRTSGPAGPSAASNTCLSATRSNDFWGHGTDRVRRRNRNEFNDVHSAVAASKPRRRHRVMVVGGA